MATAKGSTKIQFDATKVAPEQPREVLPAGWYNAKLISSSVGPTANGTGTVLKARAKVIDGEHVGAEVDFNLNTRNANAQAQEIGQRQLSSLCHAVGVLRLTDSTQLHGRPFQLKLKLRPAEGEYEARNDASGFKAIQIAEAGEGEGTAEGEGEGAGTAEGEATEGEGSETSEATDEGEGEGEGEGTGEQSGTFFILDNGEPKEVSAAELASLVVEEGFDPETPVCRAGDSAWANAAAFGFTVPEPVVEEKPTPPPVKKPAAPKAPAKPAAPAKPSAPAKPAAPAPKGKAVPAATGKPPWAKK